LLPNDAKYPVTIPFFESASLNDAPLNPALY
jgi:hypothetical protein